MSLSVDVFVIEKNGEIRYLDVPPGCSGVAGFERTRTDLWGSEIVRSLGARFFPQLATTDLQVAPDQIQEFLDECAMIAENISLVASCASRAEDYIAARLNNIVKAAQRAQQAGGGVTIW